jgi:hypothetical protein
VHGYARDDEMVKRGRGEMVSLDAMLQRTFRGAATHADQEIVKASPNTTISTLAKHTMRSGGNVLAAVITSSSNSWPHGS